MSSPTDLHDRFCRAFEENWDRPLLLNPLDGRSWTYGDVLRRAAWTASWLDDHAGPPGGPVPLAPANGPIVPILYLGILLSGRTALAIDPGRGSRDLDEMLEAAPEAPLWTDVPALLERDDVVDLRGFEPGTADADPARTALREVDVEAPFLVTFTSGTTGVPKGVVHSLGNLVHASLGFGERFGFGPEDTFFHALPMAYMAGILNAFLLPAVHGSRIAVAPRFQASEAPRALDLAAKAEAGVLWFTPTMLALLSRLGKGPYAGGDAVGLVATAPLPAELQRGFEAEFGIPLFETYGLSETLFVSAEHPGHAGNGTGVGPPLEAVDVDLGDDGEVVVRTPWMFEGYLGESRSPVEEGAFPTGDLGRWNDDVLEILGRKKDLIIRGGVNIGPSRIEDLVREVDGVLDAGVVGQPDEILGERIVCAVVLDGGPELTRAIQRRVLEELGEAHRLDEVVRVEQLPRDEAGTLDRRELKERLEGSD